MTITRRGFLAGLLAIPTAALPIPAIALQSPVTAKAKNVLAGFAGDYDGDTFFEDKIKNNSVSGEPCVKLKLHSLYGQHGPGVVVTRKGRRKLYAEHR